MNWFKETMDHYPFSGYSAMSWCGYVYYIKIFQLGPLVNKINKNKNQEIV